MLALLKLDQYFVDQFTLEANSSIEGHDERDAKLNVDFNMARASDGTPKFELKLSIDINKSEEDYSNAPYRIHLQITGYFSFPEGTEEKIVQKLIAPNGLAILYGSARNVVSQMTGIGRFGRLTLPSVNFLEIIKEKAQATKDV
jgi:preprotein translocase subunit SecB